MKHLVTFASLWYGVASAHAEVSLKEIRTASDTVLVAFFTSDNVNGPVWERVFEINEVNTREASLWKLNGKPLGAIHQFATEADGVEYHVYLQTPKLVNGQAYTLETPHGKMDFVFDDRQTLCESIKVNQNAYCAMSRVRYANFAIWLGTGGPKPIEGSLPTYTVFQQFTGEAVARGALQPIGQDASSGDFVYRIDLSAVPEGGPYRISVHGYGCSHPFGVGGDFSRRLAYTSFRSLY